MFTTPFLPTSKVEMDPACQEWLKQLYPDCCIFQDVTELIHNDIPTDRLLSPKEIRFRSTAWCVAHERNCKIPLNKKSRLVQGAPCVLFSRFVGNAVSKFWYAPGGPPNSIIDSESFGGSQCNILNRGWGRERSSPMWRKLNRMQSAQQPSIKHLLQFMRMWKGMTPRCWTTPATTKLTWLRPLTCKHFFCLDVLGGTNLACKGCCRGCRLHPRCFGFPSGRPRQYRLTWDPKTTSWNAPCPYLQSYSRCTTYCCHQLFCYHWQLPVQYYSCSKDS